MRLYHLHLVAPDVPAATEFYVTYFGFRRVFPDADEVFLRDDAGFLLAIAASEGPAHRPQKEFHLGFQARDASAARALFDRMTGDGVPIEIGFTELPQGTVKFHCVDPAGYAVEVRWDAP